MRSSISLACFTLLFAAGCDCAGKTNVTCTSDSECQVGYACVDGLCKAPTDAGPLPDSGYVPPDGSATDGSAPGCTTDSQCGAGNVCVGGGCCASDAACGSSCCSGAEVCFANACVVPGAACRSSDDCGDGEYCEPALGDGGGSADGGVPGPDAGAGAVCLGAVPTAGRCVALPPRCMGDPMPGETCLRSCEYRPPTGPLNATAQWSWGASTVSEFANSLDVWATPTVGRITDTNCDGVVDQFDPPNVVFVSGNARGTCCSCGGYTNTCHTGVLRVLDGRSGQEVWSLRRGPSSSTGWSGLSVAIGDVDHDGDMEIAAVTGEGYIALVDHTGAMVALSDHPIPGWTANATTGWGGGLSIADMDHDGNPEIAYGNVVFTTDGASITRLWVGTAGWGRTITQAISVFENLDADAPLELLAGRTAYDTDGSILWDRSDLPRGFSAVANFDSDPEPEVALIANAHVYLLSGATGMNELPPAAATGSGNGGPPTIADFDGDGQIEIGIAWANYYEVFKPNYAGGSIDSLWATPSHDFSSSVTGSTVFDFEGDGAAEVIYNDECFLWVYDGATGAVRFATPTTSFTATESSLVADVDADGSAEIVMISNGASPSNWHCDVTFRGVDWTMPAPMSAADYGRPGWVGSDGANAAYRGLTVFRATDNSWVGTRTLWNQHAYSVSNICGDRGDACSPPSTYGDIPQDQVANWTVGFLNNFRQNIQGAGIFDAPDATVQLEVQCGPPVHLVASVRNLGAALLPDGVEVGFFLVQADGTERDLGHGMTTTALFPGQVDQVSIDAPADVMATGSTFRARILIDPTMPTFQECRTDNDQSEDVTPHCLG